MAKAVRRLLPPWLMKGRVMPVRGMKLVTPPMLRKVWAASTVVSPLANKSPKVVRLRYAIRVPRRKGSRKKRSSLPLLKPCSIWRLMRASC